MKKVLVVAGNREEFKYGCLNRDPSSFNRVSMKAIIDGKEYIFINSPIQMKGFRGVRVEFWGTAGKRKDIDEFLIEAEYARRA